MRDDIGIHAAGYQQACMMSGLFCDRSKAGWDVMPESL